MPPKKGTKKKKAAPTRESEETPVTCTDVQYNPEIIDGLLLDLQAQVDAKCVLIKKDIDFMATSIKQAFHLELIKLPAQVKTMSIAKFRKEYGDSLEAVAKGAIEGVDKASTSGAKGMDSVMMSATKARRQSSKVFQTPCGKAGDKFVCETPITRTMRAAREGEMILSANGSPLGEFSTVVKAPKANNSIIPETPRGVSLKLDSGEDVDMDNIDALSEGAKEEALNKMQEMMKNMQSLMAKLAAK